MLIKPGWRDVDDTPGDCLGEIDCCNPCVYHKKGCGRAQITSTDHVYVPFFQRRNSRLHHVGFLRVGSHVIVDSKQAKNNRKLGTDSAAGYEFVTIKWPEEESHPTFMCKECNKDDPFGMNETTHNCRRCIIDHCKGEKGPNTSTYGYIHSSRVTQASMCGKGG